MKYKITKKSYTANPVENSVVNNATVGAYKTMGSVEIPNEDSSKYGGIISVSARGYAGIPVPAWHTGTVISAINHTTSTITFEVAFSRFNS